MTSALQDEVQRASPGEIKPVPEFEGDETPSAFRAAFAAAGTPMVWRGAAKSWGCVERWSPAFFRDAFGDEEIYLMNASVADLAQNDIEPGERITIAEVVDAIERGDKHYPRFLSLLQDHPRLLADYDVAFLEAMRHPLNRKGLIQFFMGGAGTNTALHNAIPANLFVQVCGQKRWRIFSPECAALFEPPLTRSTYFFSEVDALDPDDELVQKLSGWDVVLEPGDVLYNPPFFWHQVENLSSTIGVGYRWFPARSIVKASKTQALLTLCAVNPPVWVARRNSKNFPKNFRLSKPTNAR